PRRPHRLQAGRPDRRGQPDACARTRNRQGVGAKMKALPLGQVYQLLEPGPVTLLTTARKGRANVMTMSWHMMLEFEPPLLACVCSSANYSFESLRATGECVIALPARRLAPTAVKIGNCSGREVDKFKAFGLTPVAASQVQAPLIK